MLKVLSVEDSRATEAAADAAGYSYDAMMEDAGRALADRALTLIEGLDAPQVTLLIGSGNNGGDGLVAGRYIAQDREDAQVRFYLLKQRDDAHFIKVQEAGLFIAVAEDDKDGRVLRNMVASTDLVIDALFGIGIRLPIRDDAQKLLRNTRKGLNERASARRAKPLIDPEAGGQIERPPEQIILAVDCPSGLDCDSGELDSNALHANETVTFISVKPGLLESPGSSAVGRLHIAPLNMPENITPLEEATDMLLDNEAVRNLMPVRPIDGHKGTFGKAFIAAGSINYTGAAGLAAKAAYRSGAGLVTVAGPGPVVASLAAQLLEVTWILLSHDMGVLSEEAAKTVLKEIKSYSALCIGPGIGTEETTREFLRKILGEKQQPVKRQIGFGVGDSSAASEPDEEQNALPPLIVDADGLNLLAEIESWWELLPENTILTPHPGEMARLCDIENSAVVSNRRALVREKAQAWQAIIVLKGAHTLIAAPDGRIATSPFKTDALATAGTGDVLSGLIVGLLAQGLDPLAAAQVGVFVHGLAGHMMDDAIGGGRGTIASDVVEIIPSVLRFIREG